MTQVVNAANLPRDEVNALNQIAKTMGANWTFDEFACGDLQKGARGEPERNFTCVPGLDNNTLHVSVIKFKRQNLAGVLPPELVQLPHLKEIDFAYNFLSGSIPVEWASLPLTFISVFGNRLSGNIPRHLGNITSLEYLDLEVNQFSGVVPPELGKLVNLTVLRLSSNRLSGILPIELGMLENLEDVRINDNEFNGSIPDFIQKWKQLTRLEVEGSGLKGPIPSSISVLDKLIRLRISDIDSVNQAFPSLENSTGLTQLTLKNCNIVGEIPAYIWKMNSLRALDLTFNKLRGQLPVTTISQSFKIIFLSNNSLSGDITEAILRRGISLDLSYNNFTWQDSEKPACQRILNSNTNLFRSSSMERNLRGALPCRNEKCEKYQHFFHINCGGDAIKVNEITYEKDTRENADSVINDVSHWGLSSTGDYKDDDDFSNKGFTIENRSANVPELYQTARISPLSLTYFGFCLQNGKYEVSLHFAEIQLMNGNQYSKLGRRIFDIYIQGELVEKDFNIVAEAHGALSPFIKRVTSNVTDNVLEIRFTWAGKGTTAIPASGVYGPLISAISVEPTFPVNSGAGGKTAAIVVGIVGFLSIICLVLGIIWWRSHLKAKRRRQNGFKGLDLQISLFTLKQIRAATGDFGSANKIGEGGFGPVYKGKLSDGTAVAVKQLSSKSNQGNREFLNEVSMISCLQHPNLVKLYGCCIEGDQLLLIYEYMENNSLACALFGPENSQLKLDWSTRHKICVGIAKGLAFLHEESRLKIVHRDIKGTNVLLEKDLNPKISDFGLAKLYEEEKTHISTRVAGTIGYMAPEYALWGYLTYKADVYSFGIVALEIVTGKHNMSYIPELNCFCLLDWACQLERSGKLIELVDQRLKGEFNNEEAERMIRVALLCTNASAALRPTMSEVVSMLEGTMNIPEVIPESSTSSQDLRFLAVREHQKQIHSQSLPKNQASRTTSTGSGFLSASGYDLYEMNEESYLRNKALRDNCITESVVSDTPTSASMCPSWTASSSKSSHDLYHPGSISY